MKLGAAVLFALLLFPASIAASVTLRWDANTEPNLSGYEVSIGTTSGRYSRVVPVGMTTLWTFRDGTPNVTYYFAIQAVNTAGVRSELSAEVSATYPADAPPPPPPPGEICGDTIDNNGDGQIDEGCMVTPPPPPGPFDHATGIYTLEHGSTKYWPVGTVALKALVASFAGDTFRGSRLLWLDKVQNFESTNDLKAYVAAIEIPGPPQCADVPSVFVTRWAATTGKPGSRMRVDFQLASISPITEIQARLKGDTYATITGTDLRGAAGIWLTTPVPGTYDVTVWVKNAAGCTREAAAPVKLTVKQ